jgi:hypothetical protein
MRAREFIREQRELPPESSAPMRYAYNLPGLKSSDPYQTYRVGVAVARARADAKPDDVNPYKPEWSAEAAFGENAVVVGMNSGIEQVIDTALRMAGVPGGKQVVSSPESQEPAFVNNKSIVKSFKGYPR